MSERDAMTRSSPDCPSEAVLDAYELGELKNASLCAHIDGCPHCQERLRLRREDFHAMPRRDEIVRAVHVAVAARGDSDRGPRAAVSGRRSWLAAVAGLAAAAMAVLWIQPVDPTSTATVRTKGVSIALSVYVDREGGGHRALSGDAFRPGERIRFAVDLPRDAYLLIVGREASGHIYNAFPTGATGAAASARRVKAGVDRVLPGAVVLDDSRGRETLYLVACDDPFDSRQVNVSAQGVRAPSGCLTTPFVLAKVDR